MDGVCGLQILIVGGIGLQIRCNGKLCKIAQSEIFFLAIHFSREPLSTCFDLANDSRQPLSTCFDLPNASWRRGAAGADS